MKNFSLIGAAGYVAPRHMDAIRATGNRLIAATDPRDSVGVLDRHFLGVKYFPEIERFGRFLEKVKNGPEDQRIHYVSICSPNYLHDAHVRMALRAGADVICEKPLVINPWNLDQLAQIEEETGGRINTVFQLRLHPDLVALKEQLQSSPKRHQVTLSYVSARGPWYDHSWKGSLERSGGVAMNIGVHFFDLLLWLFGDAEDVEVHLREPRRMSGHLRLKSADVRWFLSVDAEDLPFEPVPGESTTFRSIEVDDRQVEFSENFGGLHTMVYEGVLAGQGLGIEAARPAIELVHRLRTAELVDDFGNVHPMLGSVRC